MYRVDMGSTLVRAITAFVHGGHSRRTLLRDSYLGVNFNDTRTWGCVMLAISAIGCSDHLRWLWDVGGPTGAPSRLGCGEFFFFFFFFGAVGGLIYFWAIGSIGRSDCSDVLCKGLMDFEHQGGWSL